MADRTVLVRLKAEVSGFQAAMAAAGASSKKAEDDLARFSANGGTSLGRLTYSATEHTQAWNTSGIALLGFGAAAAAGVGLAVSAFADFDSKMSQVQTLSHATSGEMDQLTNAALNMGQGIGFSAGEVADAQIELVKAGVSVSDIMGGALVGSLNLAAAGQIDVGKATEIATIAMTQFGLQGKDIPHVADLLAAGADKALGGVSDLGEALKSGGLVAHQFGMTIDDTVGTLSAFAQSGLMGEAAGTDLRQMLLKLAAPSKTASDDMKSLGMSLYDSSGHFVGITNLAGQLKDKMSGLSESERNAMEAHIFGARSIVGANILYQQGAEGIQGWIDKVNDTGFAMQQAQGKMNNLKGDMSKLQAAWETGMIQMGSSANGFVRPVVQGITDVIHGFDALPEPVKGGILALSAIAGAGALAAGGFLTLTPKVLDTIQGFKQLSADGSKIPGTLSSIGKAAGIAAAGLIAFGAAAAVVNHFQPDTSGMDETTQAVLKMGNSTASVDKLFSAFNNKGLAAAGINSVADALHRLNSMNWAETISKGFNDLSGGVMTDSLKAARGELDKLDGSLVNLTGSGYQAKAAAGFKQMADSAAQQGVTLDTTAKSFPKYLDSLRAQASQAGITLTSQELLNWAVGKVPPAIAAAAAQYGSFTDAMGQSQPVTKEMQTALDQMGLSADGTTSSLEKLVTSMEQAGLIQLSANDALRNYYASLDAVDASIKKNGKSLDIHTEAGRANQAALDGVAKASLDVVQANAKNGESQETLSKNLHTGYNDLMANYAAFGITGDAADTLARKALGIPKDVPIDTAIQNYADTMLKLQGISTAADQAARDRVAHIIFQTDASGFYDPSAGLDGKGAGSGSLSKSPRGFATGGMIGAAGAVSTVGGFPGGGLLSGPGTGTSDSFAIRASNGEFMQPVKAVQKYGVQFMEQVRAGTYQPTAAYFAAPTVPAGGAGANGRASGAVIHQEFNISDQQNPVATAHEVTRRISALMV